jgi:hypothetical protein
MIVDAFSNTRNFSLSLKGTLINGGTLYLIETTTTLLIALALRNSTFILDTKHK